MNADNPGRVNSIQREEKAREYRRIALLIRSHEGDKDASGALIYEAAKQCINAVASQRGTNSGPTAAKVRFLQDLAVAFTDLPKLLEHWQAASALHVNSDRLHLSESQYEVAWTDAQVFIDEMLLIYTVNQ
ncbi:MAG: hypothetical protein F4X65_12525 [Chloroflexi bacterium]|nr:hypothetical protein [Chloroflexota bacterium]